MSKRVAMAAELAERLRAAGVPAEADGTRVTVGDEAMREAGLRVFIDVPLKTGGAWGSITGERINDPVEAIRRRLHQGITRLNAVAAERERRAHCLLAESAQMRAAAKPAQAVIVALAMVEGLS